MRKFTPTSAEAVCKSRYTKLVEALPTGFRIYSHTHPRISGAFVVVHPPHAPGMSRTDWTAYKTLEDAQQGANTEYTRSRGFAGIGT